MKRKPPRVKIVQRPAPKASGPVDWAKGIQFTSPLPEAVVQEIAAAARPLAKLVGEPGPWQWLFKDHPTRVNLILEKLGRPERL